MNKVDYRKSPEGVLCDLIMKDNPGKDLQPEWFTFSDPVVNVPTDDIPRDTKITASSSESSRYIGAMDFYYNRIDIERFRFGGLVRTEDLRANVNGLLYSDDLYAEVSRIFDINVTREMLVREVLPVVTNEDEVLFTVKFKPTSKTIVGEITIVLYRVAA